MYISLYQNCPEQPLHYLSAPVHKYVYMYFLTPQPSRVAPATHCNSMQHTTRHCITLQYQPDTRARCRYDWKAIRSYHNWSCSHAYYKRLPKETDLREKRRTKETYFYIYTIYIHVKTTLILERAADVVDKQLDHTVIDLALIHV